MDSLHCDNAREFRGDMLLVACNEYDIDLILRPVKKPRYGAHIERLMGTVSEALKSLKGATFSGPEQKGEYDADGNACLTLEELEKWLILMFTNYHCNLVHTGIGTTPEQRWREGLMGTKTLPRRGLQPPPADIEKLRLDFLPFHERVINPGPYKHLTLPTNREVYILRVAVLIEKKKYVSFREYHETT